MGDPSAFCQRLQGVPLQSGCPVLFSPVCESSSPCREGSSVTSPNPGQVPPIIHFKMVRQACGPNQKVAEPAC